MQEMEFFNIGGAKVFYYYGLDTVRSSDHVMGAGPHVRDTCIGVLMLDQYKIQERPGEYITKNGEHYAIFVHGLQTQSHDTVFFM